MIDNNSVVDDGLKLSILHFDLIYFIQLKRIACDLSQAELSFLIGRESGFIAARESFRKPREFWMNDVMLLSKIFKCSPIEFFRQLGKEPGEIILNAKQQKKSGRIHYEVFQLFPGSSAKLLYRINETDPLYKYDGIQKAAFLMYARRAVAKLMEEGYFDGISRNPAEVFFQCKKDGGEQIKACFVAQALEEYVQRTEYPALLRRKDRKTGFTYQCL